MEIATKSQCGAIIQSLDMFLSFPWLLVTQTSLQIINIEGQKLEQSPRFGSRRKFFSSRGRNAF